MSKWQHDAACKEEDPEIFYPVGYGTVAKENVLAAKRICNLCPVKLHCLTMALRSGQDYGIWGGLTEEERRSLLRLARKNRVPRNSLVELVSSGVLSLDLAQSDVLSVE